MVVTLFTLQLHPLTKAFRTYRDNMQTFSLLLPLSLADDGYMAGCSDLMFLMPLYVKFFLIQSNPF